MMQEDLERIRKEAAERLGSASVPEAIEQIRVEFLGRKGSLTELLKGMKDVAKEDRPKIGQMVNDTRARIEASIVPSARGGVTMTSSAQPAIFAGMASISTVEG